MKILFCKCIMMLMIFVFSTVQVTYAGNEGKGGDYTELMNYLSLSFMNEVPQNLKNQKSFSYRKIRSEFCSAASDGVNRLSNIFQKAKNPITDRDSRTLNFNKDSVGKAKEWIKVICKKHERFRLDIHLKNSETGHPRLAENNATIQQITVNPQVWIWLASKFSKEEAQRIKTIIATHEILSLMGYESTGQYPFTSLLLVNTPTNKNGYTIFQLNETAACKYYFKLRTPEMYNKVLKGEPVTARACMYKGVGLKVIAVSAYTINSWPVHVCNAAIFVGPNICQDETATFIQMSPLDFLQKDTPR
jgi:hypothetical protein